MKCAVQILKSNEVDLVGLQEFQPEQYDKWIKRASGQYDIWPGFTETEGFLRNSIAWRKDKFSMVSNTWVKLPYFKGDVLRMPVVLLKSLQTNQQFYVMNFQNPANVRGNAEQWRVMGQRWQIALVNQLRASNNLPILWTGDMNTREQVFCRVTAQAGMISANGGYNDGTTCQPPSKMVVDWIFGSGVKFKKYAQLRDGKIAADHRPQPDHDQGRHAAAGRHRPARRRPPAGVHHADRSARPPRRSPRPRRRPAPRSRPPRRSTATATSTTTLYLEPVADRRVLDSAAPCP